MVYRIFTGIFLVLTGLSILGVSAVPAIIIGVCGVIGGIALLISV